MTGTLVRLMVVTLAVITSAACSGGPPPVGKGDLVRIADLTGEDYVLGARPGRTQALLCQIALAAVQAAGAGVRDRCNGDDDVREALLSRRVDIYWEDTGTASRTYLVDPAGSTPADVSVDAVRSRDAANGVTWLSPAALEVTSGLAVDSELGRRRNVLTVSDGARLAMARTDVVWCLTRDFVERADGWPAVQRRYGVTVAPERLRVVEADMIPGLLRAGTCTLGEVDPLAGSSAARDGLTVLDDDQRAVGRYPTAPVVRRDIRAADRIHRVLGHVACFLDDQVLARLDARVAGGQAPSDVARDWVRGLPVP